MTDEFETHRRSTSDFRQEFVAASTLAGRETSRDDGKWWVRAEERGSFTGLRRHGPVPLIRSHKAQAASDVHLHRICPRFDQNPCIDSCCSISWFLDAPVRRSSATTDVIDIHTRAGECEDHLPCGFASSNPSTALVWLDARRVECMYAPIRATSAWRVRQGRRAGGMAGG